MIDITGCDLVVLVKKAYQLSVPQGMGFIHARPGGLSDDEAKALIHEDRNFPVQLDYVLGRAVKMTVFKTKEGRLEIGDSWYDHSHDDLDKLLLAIGKERVS